MTFRWLENSEIDELVNPALEARGWAVLNVNEVRPTCRVLGAFLEDGTLIEIFACQLYPVLGPMLRMDSSIRDSGETSRQLATIMEDFLKESDARDFMAIANSPMTVRLCERFGMKPVSVPVYVKKGGG